MQLTTVLDEAQSVKTVVDALVRQFVATTACVWLYDPRAHTLHLRATAGAAESLPAALRETIHIPTFPQKIGWVARTRRPFIGADIQEDLQFDAGWVARERLVGAAVYPLIGRNELRGVLAVFTRETLPLETGEVLSTLASILASTLDTLDLLKQEHRSREAAAAAEQRYRDLVNSLEAIIWEGDAETLQFTFVSQQAERILGYPLRRWTEEPGFWTGILHPEDRDWAVSYCSNAARNGMDHAFEYRAIAADGSVRWLRDLVYVVRGPEGKPRWLRGVMLDITDRKLMEEELKQRAAPRP